LGNVRVSFDKNPSGGARIIQQDEYYSFGLRSGLYDLSNGNRYLYNGKERQADLTDQYDYGARFYDPVIGRFGTIDRFAEKYSSMTPYQYAALDPIKNIDINGDSVWVSHSKGFLGLGGKEHLRYDNVTFTIRTVQLIAAR
jgi:RHS repeat-associated protein